MNSKGWFYLLCIDPGTTSSGWFSMKVKKKEVKVVNGVPHVKVIKRFLEFGIGSNEDVIQLVFKAKESGFDQVVVEWVANFGKNVGETTFRTCEAVGQFKQAWNKNDAFAYLLRKEVVTHLLGSSTGGDAQVREALARIYQDDTWTGQRFKGPLAGINTHMLSALAVAETWVNTVYSLR